MILNFSKTKEVNDYFNNWHDLTEQQRLQGIRNLKKLGNLSTRVLQAVEATFKCPLHSFDLVRACKLESCHYHIGSDLNKSYSEDQAKAAAYCKNCLINCLDGTKNGRLSAQEVATLLSLSISEVNNISVQTVAKVKRTAIKEALEKYQIPKYQYIDGHCVHCEISIIDELELGTKPELVILPDKFGWCSQKCKDIKPKWQFFIEKEFLCYYLDALAVGYSVYKNIENLGHVFFITNDILKNLKKKIVSWHNQYVC